MGFGASGSDLDERMIDYTRANIEWLSKWFPMLNDVNITIAQGDATQHQWQTRVTVSTAETDTATETTGMTDLIEATDGANTAPLTISPSGSAPLKIGAVASERGACNGHADHDHSNRRWGKHEG